MIRVEHLTKTYKTGEREIHALRDVTFDIHEGDFLTITGRSGSGKSTLLYQLGLLDHPTSGTVYIDEVDVGHLDQNARTQYRLQYLGYVFQDYALVPTLTAAENALITMRMLGHPFGEALDAARDALQSVGLAERAGNLPSQLSGGEQQRVSIARAIVNTPKILFADEPTANLDSETAQQIMDLFRELHRGGQTIVMVTHEPEYMQMGNRNIHLSDGAIESQT